MASLDELESTLEEASRLLDQAAKQIRDLDPDRTSSIRRIGTAIALASEIRCQIHATRPDLMPDYMRNPRSRRRPSR